MFVGLHANAATTPKVRAYIQASGQPVAALARELGISETTVRRWKKRPDAADRSSAPHAVGECPDLCVRRVGFHCFEPSAR